MLESILKDPKLPAWVIEELEKEKKKKEQKRPQLPLYIPEEKIKTYK